MAPVRSDGNGNGANKWRGRPPGRKSTGVTKPAQKPVPTAKPTTKPAKKPTKKKQAARAESEDELSLFVAEQPPSSRARKRIAPVDADEIAEDEPQSRKKYVQLEARIKRIPQEQIDTWPQLSAPVLEQIVAVMREAKKDIANTQRDERRVIAAHNALNPLVRTLSRQLATSRIPPHAKDMHFNIDKLTDRIAHVSREVTTARHSKQLLSEQAKVAERQLLKDEQNLKELKTNAKKWRSEWKHQEKHGQLHPLLQESQNAPIRGDTPDEIGLKQSAPVDTALLDAPDAELAPVLEQLRRSLKNTQGNHAQVEGVDDAMQDAQAALDEVLFRHASAQQYAVL